MQTQSTVEFSTLGGPEVLQYVDRVPAPPRAGEVQIAMKAAGLNNETTTNFRVAE